MAVLTWNPCFLRILMRSLADKAHCGASKGTDDVMDSPSLYDSATGADAVEEDEASGSEDDEDDISGGMIYR